LKELPADDEVGGGGSGDGVRSVDDCSCNGVAVQKDVPRSTASKVESLPLLL